MTERKTLKQIAEEGLARERAARKAANDLIRGWIEQRALPGIEHDAEWLGGVNGDG